MSAPDYPSLDTILEGRLLPLLDLSTADPYLDVVDALAAGGVSVAEIALRRPGSLTILQKLVRERPDLLLGAGTVRTPEQAHQCIDAGAAFIVSPGLSEAVVQVAQKFGVPIVPGAATPTEVMHATELGLSVVKLFPASVIGGPAAVRALSGPFPEIRFVPTGGIDATNAEQYLTLPSVAAIGGSWMVASEILATGDFGEMARRTAVARAAVEALKS